MLSYMQVKAARAHGGEKICPRRPSSASVRLRQAKRQKPTRQICAGDSARHRGASGVNGRGSPSDPGVARSAR